MNWSRIKVKWKRWFYQDMPDAATLEEWDDFNKQAAENKIRWFLTDTFPYWVSKTFIWPVGRAQDYIRWRTFDRYHIIKIHSLEPGYYDKDTQLLHGMFDLLTDFVEVEAAWMGYVFSDRRKRKWGIFKVWGRTHWHRSREEGLKHLDWEISLGDESKKKDPNEYSPLQAKAAQEVKELYLWWKDTRPSRIDPYETPEFIAHYEKYVGSGDRIGGHKSDQEKKDWMKMNKKMVKLENQYEAEDTRMLLRLVRVRKSLWT